MIDWMYNWNWNLCGKDTTLFPEKYTYEHNSQRSFPIFSAKKYNKVTYIVIQFLTV